MVFIKAKNGSQPICLYHNCLLIPQSSEVMGLVLGNCVYGKTGVLKGKIINHSLYNTGGEKIAVENLPGTFDIKFNHHKLSEGRWAILQAIKDHNSPWVEPKEKWAETDLLEYLNG